MSNAYRQNDYYARLVDCSECPAQRGSRCTDGEGRDIHYPHSSRIAESGVVGEKATEKTSVVCPSCKAQIGVSCRGPYGNRLSRPHVGRLKEVEAARA